MFQSPLFSRRKRFYRGTVELMSIKCNKVMLCVFNTSCFNKTTKNKTFQISYKHANTTVYKKVKTIYSSHRYNKFEKEINAAIEEIPFFASTNDTLALRAIIAMPFNLCSVSFYYFRHNSSISFRLKLPLCKCL